MQIKHLILWRHAEAEDLLYGQQDLGRALTHKGKKHAKRMAQWLKRYVPNGSVLLVSPAKRAIQTAEAWRDDYQIVPTLQPDAQAKHIVQWLQSTALQEHPQVSTLVLVGHQPWIGELASYALTGNIAPISFKKGAVWWMTLPSSGAPYKLYCAQTPDLA